MAKFAEDGPVIYQGRGLSNANIREYLDTKQNNVIIRWLNDRRIPWTIDTKGRPIMTLAAIEGHLFGIERDRDEAES